MFVYKDVFCRALILWLNTLSDDYIDSVLLAKKAELFKK